MSKEFICPVCGSDNLIRDSSRGELYCKDCGIVVEDFDPVQTAEYDDNSNKTQRDGTATVHNEASRVKKNTKKINNATQQAQKKVDELKKENEELKRAKKAEEKAKQELKKVLKEVDAEIQKNINEGKDTEGLRNLRSELVVIGTSKDGRPSREAEAPGTLKAVRKAYKDAGYKSQIGEGVGRAVHHLDGYNWDVNNRTEGSNLILLSKKIHDEFHDMFGKGNNTKEQFLEFLLIKHPEEVSKFMETYMKDYDMKSIGEKLSEASVKWDDVTWSKQYNRHRRIAYRDDLTKVQALGLNPILDNVSYDSFFIKNMDVPLDGEYDIIDKNGKAHTQDHAQLTITDPEVLKLYDAVKERDFEKYNEIDEETGDYKITDEDLRNILIARRIVEAQNGIGGQDMPEYDFETGKWKTWDSFGKWSDKVESREEILRALSTSYFVGREALEKGVKSGVAPSFEPLEGRQEDPNKVSGILRDMGMGDGSYKGTGENPTFLGSGFVKVLDDLKHFFDTYKGNFGDVNPLEKWDSSKSIAPGSDNEKLITGLFEKGGFTWIYDLVAHNLPIDPNTEGVPESLAERQRLFKEYQKEHSDAKDLKDFLETWKNVQYLTGILRENFDNETIARYFKNDGGRMYLHDKKDKQRIGWKVNDKGDVISTEGDSFIGTPMDEDDERRGKDPRLITGKERRNPEDPTNYKNRGKDTSVFYENSGRTTTMSNDKISLEELKDFKDSVDKINDSLNVLASTIDSVLSAMEYATGVKIPRPKSSSSTSNSTGSVDEMLKEEGVGGEEHPTPTPSFRGGSEVFHYGDDEVKEIYKKRVVEYEELLGRALSEKAKNIIERALKTAKRIADEGLKKDEVLNEELFKAFYGKSSSKLEFTEEELESEIVAHVLSQGLIRRHSSDVGRKSVVVDALQKSTLPTRGIKEYDEWEKAQRVEVAEQNPLYKEYERKLKQYKRKKEAWDKLQPNQQMAKSKEGDKIKELGNEVAKLAKEIYEPIDEVLKDLRKTIPKRGKIGNVSNKLSDLKKEYQRSEEIVDRGDYDVYNLRKKVFDTLEGGEFAELNEEQSIRFMEFREARRKKAYARKKLDEAQKSGVGEAVISAYRSQYEQEAEAYEEAFNELTSFARENKTLASPFIELAMKDIKTFRKEVSFWERKIEEGAKSPKQERYYYAKRREAFEELRKAKERLNKLGGSFAYHSDSNKFYNDPKLVELNALGVDLADITPASYYGSFAPNTIPSTLKMLGQEPNTTGLTPIRRTKGDNYQDEIDASYKSSGYEPNLENILTHEIDRINYLGASFAKLKEQIQIKKEDVLDPNATEEVKVEYDALVNRLKIVQENLAQAIGKLNGDFLSKVPGEEIITLPDQIPISAKSMVDGLDYAVEESIKDLEKLALTADEVIEKAENLKAGIGGGFSDKTYSLVDKYVRGNFPNQEPTLYNTPLDVNTTILSDPSNKYKPSPAIIKPNGENVPALVRQRFEYYHETYNSLKQQIEEFRPLLLSPGVTDETKAQYDALVEKINNVILKFGEVSENSHFTDDLQKELNDLTKGFDEVTISANQFLKLQSENFGVRGVESTWANYGNFSNDMRKAFAEWEDEQGFAPESVWANHAYALNDLMKRREELARLASNPILFNVQDIDKVRDELRLVDDAIKTLFPGDKRNIEVLLKPVRAENWLGDEGTFANYGSSYFNDFLEWDKVVNSFGKFDFNPNSESMSKFLGELIEKRERLIKQGELSLKYDTGNTDKIREELVKVDTIIKSIFPNDKRDITIRIRDPETENWGVRGTESAFANYGNLNLNDFIQWEEETDASETKWGNYSNILDKLMAKRDKLADKLRNIPLFIDTSYVTKLRNELKLVDENIKTIFSKDKFNLSSILEPSRAKNWLSGNEGTFANYGKFNINNYLNDLLKNRNELIDKLSSRPIPFNIEGTDKAIEQLKIVNDTIKEYFPGNEIDISLVINPNENNGVRGVESAFANYANAPIDSKIFKDALALQDKIGSFNFNSLYLDTDLIGKSLDKLSEKRERLRRQFDLAIKFKNIEGAENIINTLKMVDDAIKSVSNNDSVVIDFEGLKETVGTLKETSTHTNRLGSDLSRFTRKIGESTRQIGGLRGALVGLFSIVGTGRVMDDMITASSLRQTNQIMLASRRGTEEAHKLYDSIQALVVELPGNDTFLTNLLTMLGTMDKSLTESDLKYMGGVIADYYMGAQAKGQYNNETERELRNYLMTGQTRNLTNSIIASEVESLKGLNSVKERTIALEKALQKTGMDSIAHYDSYHNTLEEFKGRFQKSFADLGDYFLGFLQILMKIYNFVDAITGSFLSQITIVLGVVAMGAVTATMFLGQLADSFGDLIDMYNRGHNFLFNPKDLSKYEEAIRESILSIGLRIGVLNAESYAELSNAEAKELNLITTLKESISRWANMWAVFSETDSVLLETIAETGNTESKIIARAVLLKESIARWLHSISVMVEEGTLWENTKATIINAWEKIKSALASAYDTAVKWAGAIATNAMTVATWLLNGALAVLNILLSPIGLTILAIVGAIALFIVGIEKVGEAFGWWTDFGSMIDAISAGIHRIWDAFINSEQVQYAMYIIGGFFENLQAWFGRSSVFGGLYEMIFGTNGSAGDWDILGDIINLLGAIGGALWWLSPMDELLEILRAVGAYLGWVMSEWNLFVNTEEFQDLVDGFREIRVAFGELWAEITPIFEELGQAWAELWGEDSGSKQLKEDGHELLELFKAIAHFIRDYVIPFIKLLVPLIKVVLTPLLVTVKVITKIIEGAKWIMEHLGMQNDKAPTNIANQEGGYNTKITQQYADSLRNGKDLAKRYIHNNPQSTIINNNFAEGSVQPDARNMTKKEVQQMFTSAFGYNQARGVNGIVR